MQDNLRCSFAFLSFLIIISQRNAWWYVVCDINTFINPPLYLRCIIVTPAINLFSTIVAYLQNSLKSTQGAKANDEASVSLKQHIYLQLIVFWFVNVFFDVCSFSIPIVTKEEFNAAFAWQVANGTAGMTFKGCSGHFQVHQTACQIQDTMKILHYQSKYKVHNRQKDPSRHSAGI